MGDQGLQLAGGGDGSFSEMRSLGPPGNQMDYFLAQQVLSQCLRAQAGTLPSSPSSRWRCPRSNRLGTPPGGGRLSLLIQPQFPHPPNGDVVEFSPPRGGSGEDKR